MGAQVPDMAEIPNQPDSGDGPSASPSSGATAPRKSFARRNWGKLIVLTLLGLPLAVFGIWAAISLSWSYSSGQRVGYVQKISHKGFVCKTWEGTLYTDIAKGFRSDSFTFTVRSDSLAHFIEKQSGKKVAVHYEQHIKVPSSCFGDTEYFVTKVDTLPE